MCRVADRRRFHAGDDEPTVRTGHDLAAPLDDRGAERVHVRRTDLHDHAGSAGAFTVVSGILTERVLRGTSEVAHPVIVGRTRVFGPNYVHHVRKDGVKAALNDHIEEMTTDGSGYRNEALEIGGEAVDAGRKNQIEALATREAMPPPHRRVGNEPE